MPTSVPAYLHPEQGKWVFSSLALIKNHGNKEHAFTQTELILHVVPVSIVTAFLLASSPGSPHTHTHTHTHTHGEKNADGGRGGLVELSCEHDVGVARWADITLLYNVMSNIYPYVTGM